MLLHFVVPICIGSGLGNWTVGVRAVKLQRQILVDASCKKRT
jgi:hypothetical protein